MRRLHRRYCKPSLRPTTEMRLVTATIRGPRARSRASRTFSAPRPTYISRSTEPVRTLPDSPRCCARGRPCSLRRPRTFRPTNAARWSDLADRRSFRSPPPTASCDRPTSSRICWPGTACTSRSRAPSRSRKLRSSAASTRSTRCASSPPSRIGTDSSYTWTVRASPTRPLRSAQRLREVSVDAGVDVLSFGGTKNGLMLGEAICFFDADLHRHAAAVRAETSHAARFEDALRFGAVRSAARRRSLGTLRAPSQRYGGTPLRPGERPARRANHAAGTLQRRLRNARSRGDRAHSGEVLLLRLRRSASGGSLDDALGDDRAGRRRICRRRRGRDADTLRVKPSSRASLATRAWESAAST